MSYSNDQLLKKSGEGQVTDVKVTFPSTLTDDFINSFGGYSPEDISEDGDTCYQLFHPIQDKVVEWLEDKEGVVCVTTCHTLLDEDDESYCDIYIENNFIDGKFVDFTCDYDDTFGDSSLVI